MAMVVGMLLGAFNHQYAPNLTLNKRNWCILNTFDQLVPSKVPLTPSPDQFATRCLWHHPSQQPLPRFRTLSLNPHLTPKPPLTSIQLNTGLHATTYSTSSNKLHISTVYALPMLRC